MGHCKYKKVKHKNQNMYQITGAQVSFRISEKERDQLNEFCNHRQEMENTVFTNAKQVVLSLLSYCKQLENERDNSENNVDFTEYENKIADLELETATRLKEIEILQEQLSSLENENKSLQALNEDAFQKEMARSEREQNNLIIPCSPEQRQVLKGIAENRFKKGYSDKVDSPDEIVKQIVFREPYLYNHWGDYYTGL